jgi:hypothetical protein
MIFTANPGFLIEEIEGTKVENCENKAVPAEPQLSKHAKYIVQCSKTRRTLCNACQSVSHEGILHNIMSVA